MPLNKATLLPLKLLLTKHRCPRRRCCQRREPDPARGRQARAQELLLLLPL
jgi:hypothetical protein